MNGERDAPRMTSNVQSGGSVQLDPNPNAVPTDQQRVPENGMPVSDQTGDERQHLDSQFQAMLKQSQEETWRAAQSVMDRRFAQLENANRQQISQLQGQLATLNGYFEQATESALPDDQRQARQTQRQQEANQSQLLQAISTARYYAAESKTIQALTRLGVDLADPRINQYEDIRLSDPDQWSRLIVEQAALLVKNDYDQRLRAQEGQTGDQTRRRVADDQERQRVTQINNQRLTQPNLETGTPGGGQITFDQRMRQMTIPQRNAVNERIAKLARERQEKQGPGSGLSLDELNDIVFPNH